MGTWAVRSFQTSIGKKTLMAISGLFWCTFLVAHLAGNLFLFVGEDAFMAYANALQANKGIMIGGEVVMIVFLLVHVSTALKLASENDAARPEKYASGTAPVAASLASRTMVQTGLVILCFMVLHIWTFKFGVAPDENLYQNVVRRFAFAPYTLFYIFSLIMLGIHVSHGFQSAFQSLGLNHKKYTPLLKILGHGYAVFIAVGFSSIALYFLMRGGAA